MQIFIKKVSKGSRFNQVYIPKEMENIIEVGDLVEVKLIKKHTKLFYYNLEKLSKFKEDLIKNTFSYLNKYNDILYAFMVGSFLTENINYNDIDLVLILKKENKKLEFCIYNELINNLNLKWHIISINNNKFEHLLKTCPLTKVMFSKYICNKKIDTQYKKIIDKKHIKFLLMMPEDLLKITAPSRIFFDNLRRLITIEFFLNDKKLDINKINEELKKIIGKTLFTRIKNNEEIEKNTIENLRKIIKTKLNKLHKNL